MAEAQQKGCMGSCLGRLVSLGMAGGLTGLGVAAVALLAAAGGAAWSYQHYIVENPGAHLDRENIDAIIAQETPVLYGDGVTPVGVFFDEEHRQHVSFQELPMAYTMGIVAAEDGGYWSHPGINVKGIARAMRDNLIAGNVVAGGSTLTQQTAKNIYYRPDRSVKAKLIELVNALKLEAHYSKEEILELYANQFHVTGNGRGLGIAARHFFDKDVADLGTLESAFLAGLVKAPAYYDPFYGDEARRERARERAHTRTRYVLQRMLDEPIEHLAGPPSDGTKAGDEAFHARLMAAGRIREEARTLLDDGFELPFKRGSFRYDSSAVLDEVARRLEEPPFKELLASEGIEDPATAGLQIITTLDPAVQQEAAYGLWHHLTEVGTWMEALGPDAFLLEGHSGPRFDPDHPPAAHRYRVGRIASHQEGGLVLDLGGHPCTVDRDAIVRVAVASERGRVGSKTAKASTAKVDAFVAALPDDGVVLASVREVRAVDGEPKAWCDLEVRPELQGASIVLQDGQIRAMVGGNDNRNFNRATALRQYGSTWKPLVFHAALQLGWSPEDTLDNRRNIFPFSTTFYAPRPDHTPAPEVSMSWAGVNSENLASIWLLYHLTDRLDGEQVRALAQSLDLARRPDEAEEAYRTRIQKAGVLPTRSRVAEALFLQARQEVLASPEALQHPEDELALQSLLYGWGYQRERSRAEREGPSTRAWKLTALDNNWLTLRGRLETCRAQHEALAKAFHDREAPLASDVPDLTVLVDGPEEGSDKPTLKVACGAIPEGYVVPDEAFVEAQGWRKPLLPGLFDPFATPDPPTTGPGTPTAPASEPEPKKRRWPWSRPEPTAEAPAPPEPEPTERTPFGRLSFADVRIEDRVHASTLEAVDKVLERRQLALDLQEDVDLYGPEVLYWFQDFRVLLSLRYLTSLAEQYGVQTELQPVLSLPLGASEITLEESASVYQGLVSGKAWSVPGVGRKGVIEPIQTPSALIAEIRDVDGNVLYRATPEPVDVATETTAHLTADILRNVVQHGTGRRAHGTVTAHGVDIPVGGKTGTTNDFKNAAFLGFVPATGEGGFVVEGAWAVGVYVGYDDNRPMSNGRIRLAGASGALPAWIVAAGGAADVAARDAEKGAQLNLGPDLVRLPAEPQTGLVAADAEVVADDDGPTVLVRRASVEPPPEVAFEPLRRPPRMAPRTEEANAERRRRPVWARPQEEAP